MVCLLHSRKVKRSEKISEQICEEKISVKMSEKMGEKKSMVCLLHSRAVSEKLKHPQFRLGAYIVHTSDLKSYSRLLQPPFYVPPHIQFKPFCRVSMSLHSNTFFDEEVVGEKKKGGKILVVKRI